MGCCSSVPSHDEDNREINKRHSEPEAHSTVDHSKNKGDSSSISPTNNTIEKAEPVETWPIIVRLSSNGQDITIQAPIHKPYLTVAGLRQQLLPHFDKNAQVKLIYLGRILSDQLLIIPTETDEDTPLPPPKKKEVQIQKQGVIQAMVMKSP